MDRLSDDELHVLSGPQLLDRTKLLVESMNALAAELSRTVRVADNKQAFERDGMKSAQSWLRGHCRLSRVAASQVVRNGRALEQLPTVAVTHAAGNVTADQVTLIGLLTARGMRPCWPNRTATWPASPRSSPATPPRDAMTNWPGSCTRCSPASITTAASPIRQRSGSSPSPSTPMEASPAASTSTPSAARSSRPRSSRSGRPTAPPATLAHSRSSRPTLWCSSATSISAAARCRCSGRSDRRVKPHVAVNIDAEDLADPSTGPAAAQAGFGATLSAARARWVACDADITRIVLGPRGNPSTSAVPTGW